MLSGSVIQAGDDIFLVEISEHSNSPTGDYYSVHSYKNLSENVANILGRFEVENGVGVFVSGRRDQLYI